ncbi:MAG: hypothetical protein ABSD85_10785 [Acidimicrobiales bacterium]|jgi:hypothetical protein
MPRCETSTPSATSADRLANGPAPELGAYRRGLVLAGAGNRLVVALSPSTNVKDAPMTFSPGDRSAAAFAVRSIERLPTTTI